MTHELTVMHETRCTSCNRMIQPGEQARIPGWKQITHTDCTQEPTR